MTSVIFSLLLIALLFSMIRMANKVDKALGLPSNKKRLNNLPDKV